MVNTNQSSKVPESSNQQNQKHLAPQSPHPYGLSPPLSGEGTTNTFAPQMGHHNAVSAAALAMNDMPRKRETPEIGSNQNCFQGTVITVNHREDIIKKLMPYALEKEIFILSATGAVSYVELLNQQEAPVAKTSFHGNFHITSLEGNVVFPKSNEKNEASRVTVLVSGDDGRIRGGPVRSLIAKSAVQVVIATESPTTIESMARKVDSTTNDFPPIMDIHKKRLAEVVNKVHKATLEELNS